MSNAVDTCLKLKYVLKIPPLLLVSNYLLEVSFIGHGAVRPADHFALMKPIESGCRN